MSTQRDIAHQWAHQIKARGKASALSYEGPVIYSYTAAMGRILPGGAVIYSYTAAMGRILPGGAVILNAARLSVTTSKHQSFIRRAIPGDMRVFFYEDGWRGTDLNPTPDQLLAHALQSCRALVEKVKAARAWKDPGYWLGRVLEARQAVLDVCAHFSLPIPNDLPGEVTEEQFRAVREKIQEMEKKRMEAAREKLGKWLVGDPDTPAPQGLSTAFFRLVPSDPSTIESTLGVRVPVADFTRAVRFAMRFKGATWRPNPGEEIKVGGYQINSITPTGVVAGRHRVGWTEVERLASFL